MSLDARHDKRTAGLRSRESGDGARDDDQVFTIFGWQETFPPLGVRTLTL